MKILLYYWALAFVIQSIQLFRGHKSSPYKAQIDSMVNASGTYKAAVIFGMCLGFILLCPFTFLIHILSLLLIRKKK